MNLHDLLELVITNKASDLHISAGMPPIVRVNGELTILSEAPLGADDTKKLIYGFLNDNQKVKFEENLELDLSLELEGIGRFRVNIHRQRGNVEAAFRAIPVQIKTVEELILPKILYDLADKPNGLVLLTGPAGVGKSTSMAAIIDYINKNRRKLIVTVEDPIEYVFTNERSIIKQREVGNDTRSFAAALRHVLRQDPNVIMVGEMRDLETIQTAITAAETGHLVFSTLHTQDASQTIDRLIDVFPPRQQQEIKVQLAGCLQGIISQQLLPRADGAGRIPACEVLITTTGVKSCIREHKTEQIPTHIQTGGKYGMKMMDKSIKDLLDQNLITKETALTKVKNPELFEHM